MIMKSLHDYLAEMSSGATVSGNIAAVNAGPKKRERSSAKKASKKRSRRNDQS